MRLIFLLLLAVMSIYAKDTFYALKGGVLSHSTGPLSSGREDGLDVNVELLFNTTLLKAHPAVGADINLNGDTSFAYGGLVWEGSFFKHLLLGVSFGFAVHNGKLNRNDSDKRNLGTRLLVREAIDIGYYLDDDVVLSFMYDHYSNTGLRGKVNQGNDNMGFRVTYYF